MTPPRSWLAERFAEARIASMFLSRLPAGRVAEPVPTIAAAAWTFPVVGACIGSVGAAGYTIAVAVGLPPSVSAIVAIALTIATTGALHEDGLADIADGFGGGRDAPQKLAIMRDSRLGSYGVIALILALSLRALAIASVADWVIVSTSAIALAGASRAMMVLALYFLPAARADGMGEDASHVSLARVGLAGAVGLAALTALSPYWVIVLASMTTAALLMGWLAYRQIGGQTGDVLGAIQQCSEIAGWLAIVSLSASVT